MNEPKRRMGFATSSTEAEDAFNKVKEELLKEKADWKLVNDVLKAVALIIVNEELKDLSKVTMDSVILIFLLACANLVSESGVELMEIHERLASIEKVVGNIKLKVR